jgi:hypothetical protein
MQGLRNLFDIGCISFIIGALIAWIRSILLYP